MYPKRNQEFGIIPAQIPCRPVHQRMLTLVFDLETPDVSNVPRLLVNIIRNSLVHGPQIVNNSPTWLLDAKLMHPASTFLSAYVAE